MRARLPSLTISSKKAPGYPSLTLAESVWVLTSTQALGHAEILTAVEMLLAHENLTLDDSEAVAAALDPFRAQPALGFMDCLMIELARRAGHLPPGTFDRKLATVSGAQKL